MDREEPNYTEMNPGIRRTVRWMRSLGFDTCDSGDGTTHDYDCDSEWPYVAMLVPPEELVAQARRLQQAFKEIGITIEELSSEPKPAIQASYDPGNETAAILLTDFTDILLPSHLGLEAANLS